jgi:hypothetical protein
VRPSYAVDLVTGGLQQEGEAVGAILAVVGDEDLQRETRGGRDADSRDGGTASAA